jgi:hypothetical protein
MTERDFFKRFALPTVLVMPVGGPAVAARQLLA